MTMSHHPSRTTAHGNPPYASRVRLTYPVVPEYEAWVLKEEPVPESVPHDVLVGYLRSLLAAWAEREGRNVLVARNLAVRWIEQHPGVGVDPDLCVIEPSPPGAQQLSSLRLWQPGHSCPALAIEVVSEGHPYKDYGTVQDKYASLGVSELWILDTQAPVGTRSSRVPLQLWLRAPDGALERVHAGKSSFRSPYLGAWVCSHEGHIHVTGNPVDGPVWLTKEEEERAAKEQERAAKEQERAAKEQERAAKEIALSEARRLRHAEQLALREAEKLRAERDQLREQLAAIGKR
jgi:Uma2 family endonuclease